ncbi:A-kinase-interacting protein 1 [Nelusetta ayraudi]|uniref:A-kinase-interacting protein 1 n=1 Tax=Nelusetta ayraudi TaxID=303726 RepID=UPI003F70E45C
MADRAWLESSLRRSARLGRQVLDRASRRTVDWTSGPASWTTSKIEEDAGTSVKKTHTELDDVFDGIAVLMKQMSSQCKEFYQSGQCIGATHPEQSHVSRFHSRRVTWRSTSAPPARERASTPQNKCQPPSPDEDFLIEVSPGTYTVTASLQESQQRQTQLVSVRPGESVVLTFTL